MFDKKPAWELQLREARTFVCVCVRMCMCAQISAESFIIRAPTVIDELI